MWGWRSASFGRHTASSAPDDGFRDESYDSVTHGLADIYEKYLLPIESQYQFGNLCMPTMTEGEFKSKPMILLMGQYSTGKTTFVRHLLEKEYPGSRIGPEPTTDKFVAVCHTEDTSSIDQNCKKPAQSIPGGVAVVNKNLPWTQLSRFGSPFVDKFEVVHVDSKVFKGVSLIDTPGILTDTNDPRIRSRGYKFEDVIRWFGERVDLVLLFFDAHKLDISEEFRQCIAALKGYESKICILLNKADTVSSQQLMRVYGALMWSLGRVITGPDVPRIFIGSFWDKPLSQNVASSEYMQKFFEQEIDDLFKLIYSLPARSASRKCNDFFRRLRRCRTHLLLVDHLKKQIPTLIGKHSKHRELVDNMESIIGYLARVHSIPVDEFPDPRILRERLSHSNSLSSLPKPDMKKLNHEIDVIQNRVANLSNLISTEEAKVSPMISPSVLDDESYPRNTVWARCRSRNFMPREEVTSAVVAKDIEKPYQVVSTTHEEISPPTEEEMELQKTPPYVENRYIVDRLPYSPNLPKQTDVRKPSELPRPAGDDAPSSPPAGLCGHSS